VSVREEVLADEPPVADSLEDRQRTRAPVRFTSNIVGPILFIRDVFCFAISIPLAAWTYNLFFDAWLVPSVHLFAVVTMAGCYILIRSSKQAYRRSLVSFLDDDGDPLFDAVISSLVASALVFQFGMVDTFSRGASILYLLALVLSLSGTRPLLRALLARLARKGLIGQRIAFYGAEPTSIQNILHLLNSLHLPHLRVVGVADDRPGPDRPTDLPFIGGFEELVRLARLGEIDQVLINVPNVGSKRLHHIVEQLSEVSVDVSVIPQEAVDLAPDYRVNLLGMVPVLTLWQRPFRDMNQLVKRGEDLLLGGIALLLVAPILAVVALLVRFTSPGPVLFVQPRIGFNNEVIHVFKFRTMFAEQSDLLAEQTTTRNDPRITPVGRVLRKLSIDELPQLLNVVRGDMSLVGPRPHATHMKVGDLFYQDAVRGYAARHRVKPGITGLAQVKGLRGEIRTIDRAKRRVELDKEYIDRWSVSLDLRILLATVRAVFFDADAY
jgi:Undecaprenyl-phosphate glucose phosphotransferase